MTLQAGNPASLSRRFLAAAVDFLFLWLLLWIPVKLLVFRNIDNELAFTRGGVGAYFLHIRVLVLAIFPFCLRDVFQGKGLGKRLVGIKVVDAADMKSEPTLRQHLLRNLTNWFWPIGMAAAHAHPDKMRFGDRIAGTMVVRDEPDPDSSALVRRLLQVCAVAAAVGCCVLSMKFASRAYAGNSGISGAALEFVDRCETFREVVPGLSSDKLSFVWPAFVLPSYRATPDGAVAALFYHYTGDNASVQIQVTLERGLDDNHPWHVASGVMSFGPGGARLLRNSGPYLTAFDFLKGYEPLLEAMRPVTVEELSPGIAARVTDNDTQPVVLWSGRSQSCKVQVGVNVEPIPGEGKGWRVEDAFGQVVSGGGKDGKEKMFVFVLSRKLSRYLTDEEVVKIFRENVPAEKVIPELMEDDNVTVPPGKSSAGNTTGTSEKPSGLSD